MNLYVWNNIVPLVTVDLHLFDNDYTQTTDLNEPGNDLSPQMRDYYHDELIYAAEPKLVHNRYGQKAKVPSGSGESITFTKVTPLGKAMIKINQGKTPKGNKLDYTKLSVAADQYGDFTEVSDVLSHTAADKQILVATKRHGSQAGRTLDTVTREIITAGTNKVFAPLVSGETETEILLRADVTAGCYLTPDVVNYVAAKLERENTDTIDGSFVCIIHTDVWRDLLRDPEWVEAKKYAKPEDIEAGEVGMIGNVRFVRSTEAKIIGPADMLGIPGYNRTTLNAAVSTSADIFPVKPFTVAQATEVTARISGGAVYKLYVDGVERTVASVTGGAVGTCKITLTGTISADAGKLICGTGAGKDGTAIYCSLAIGADAYGVTEIEGLGLQHIYKPLGSAGTADPLNQRATVGWKSTAAAIRLVEQFMCRIEHTSRRFGKQAVSN